MTIDRCGECGFDYGAVEPGDVAALIEDGAGRIAADLRRTDIDLRSRRMPDQWSPLEYACHVRDVLLVQRERLLTARRVERPGVERMGRDERPDHDGYAEQDPATVADELVMAARLFVNDIGRLGTSDWQRTLIYNYPRRAERSQCWLAVHTAHEVKHHLLDVRRQVTEP